MNSREGQQHIFLYNILTRLVEMASETIWAWGLIKRQIFNGCPHFLLRERVIKGGQIVLLYAKSSKINEV